MALALGTAALVLLALLWELSRPRLAASWTRCRLRVSMARSADPQIDYDPGRERRAEQRARALLASCIDEEDWAMYRDLGFLRVWGGAGGREARGITAPGPGNGGRESSHGGSPARGAGRSAGTRYAYLIYPHKPIVAYLPESGALLNEYCVAFPDHSKPYGSARLPDSDDVLAKWMALKGDERRVIADANMHLPGRQVDPDRVRRDLLRLARWERARVSRGSESARVA